MSEARVSRIYLRGGWYFEFTLNSKWAYLYRPDGKENYGEWPAVQALKFAEAIYSDAPNEIFNEEPSRDLKNVHQHA